MLHSLYSAQNAYPLFISLQNKFTPEIRARGLGWHVTQSRITEFIKNQLEKHPSSVTAPILAALELTIKKDFHEQLVTFNNWRNGASRENIPAHEKILNLVKHFQTMDLKGHFVSCILIQQLLKYLSYIPKDVSLAEERQFVVVICHHYAAIKPNIHTMCELRNGPEAGGNILLAYVNKKNLY